MPATPPTRLLVADLAAVAPAWTFPSWAAERLRAAVPADWRLHLVSAPTVSDGDGADRPSDETLGVIGEAEVYVGFGLPRPLLAAAPALRWVHSTAAGVASVLHPELRERDILLTNSAGIHGPPMAEYVLAGVLHFLRGFDVAVRQQAEARWDREPFVGSTQGGRELGECRALVVDAGGIGQAVATLLAAHGVECTGVRRRPGRGVPPGFARVVAQDAIDAELPTADIVVLCAPLTAETRGVLSAARIARLPEGAIVVNVGRGALLDAAALGERLRAGTLRGAVLDVFEQEPLPADSPLWRLPRTLLTPHVSAVSPRRFWERELALILENWTRYREGDRLRNVVDQQAGY